jgi:hypothetical protein
MSEKRYVIPKGMLEAAILSHPFDTRTKFLPEMLEAALRWLSDNPIVPTAKQSAELESLCRLNDEPMCMDAIFYCSEWQRRMFLAPEPEVPEAIKDLMCGGSGAETGTPEQAQARVNARILTAYHRGQRAGKP